MNRPRFTPIDDGMLRRLRVLFAFVGLIWAVFAVVRIVYAATVGGGAVLTALVLVVGLGFLAASVLAHVELRARARD